MVSLRWGWWFMILVVLVNIDVVGVGGDLFMVFMYLHGWLGLLATLGIHIPFCKRSYITIVSKQSMGETSHVQ